MRPALVPMFLGRTKQNMRVLPKQWDSLGMRPVSMPKCIKTVCLATPEEKNEASHEDKPRCIVIIESQILPGAALAARLKEFHDSW